MPSDIRSFFGGGGNQASQEKPKKKEEKPAPKKRGRKVIDESEEDEPAKKATPKKAPPKKVAKKEESPKGVDTTASDFFASNGNAKPKRSEPVKKLPTRATPKKATATAASTPGSGRTSTRTKKPVTYAENNVDDDDFPDDDLEGADDIFAEDTKRTGRSTKDDYVEGSEDEDEPIPKVKSVGRGKQTRLSKEDDDFEPLKEEEVDMKDVDPEDDMAEPADKEFIVEDKPSKKGRSTTTTPKASKKRKTPVEDEEEEEDETPKKVKTAKGKTAASKTSTPAKKRAKKDDDEPEDAAAKAIFDSIPLVRPPTPPARDDSSSFKFKFGQGGHANSGAPPAAGSKDIPTGAENCLAGLTFVFTGLLDTLGREQGQSLVKQYGGKVVGAPSSKTSYVVLGSDAGPKKLETIQKYGLKTINEDGLFELIRRLPANGGNSKAAAAHEEKKQKELEKIKEEAKKMEEETRRVGGAGGAGLSGGSKAKGAAANGTTADTSLWTVKYAPTRLDQICGNKIQVEKLQRWLRNFPKSQRTGFKLAGSDGSGVYRAVMIHGPPGIGKTTAAHLVARLEGYDVVESNASDTRSKKLVEEGLKGVLSTTSLLGYFAGDNQKVEASKKKLVLIMDEVDGMSAGDRGGVGALAAVAKKTQIPMILICNDRRQPKMKPFDFCTYDLPFRRPTVDQIRSRLAMIAYRENIKMPGTVINALIEGSGADIRQVVNMMSTAKLDLQGEGMDFESGKEMSKAWEKHVILKPWDILGKILGGGMFASSSKATLNDKIELYFNDHEFSYLMLQENYLGTTPILASNYSGKERNLKLLELADKAAESISDGDLVDRMIHGSQQHWSLMPTHAVFSFVRPASFVSGSMAGYKTGFTQWLGKNSNQNKLIRMVKEIQGHMRLRTSSDRHEIRQQYVPILWQQLIKRLEVDGKEAVPEVIDLMDSYFLTKDDWDAILELGVGPMDQEKVKLESQTKATFTRLYNQQSHPLPFMKASSVAQPKKQSREKPDLEEAIDEDEDEAVEDVKEAADDDEEDMDVTKDKYVKQPKKIKAAAPKAKAAGKGKKKAADEDEDMEESEEEVKPKKGKAAARGKASGKRGGKK